MSYRDESAILRERLGELEAKHAKLDGVAAGIRFRIQENKTEAARIGDQLLLKGVKVKARNAAKNTVALVVGLSLLVGSLLGAALLFHACFNASETLEVDDAFRGAVAIHRCTIRIEDHLFTDCEAKVFCPAEGIVFQGPGTCTVEDHGTEFVSNAEPAFVVVTRVGRAVWRQADETFVFRFPESDD